MMRLNLQLFAGGSKNYTSVVDYMNDNGMASSYGDRKDLAESLGISGYKGTAEQNNKLLSMLQSGSKNSGSNGGNTTGNTSAPKTSANTPKINGVSQPTMETINTPFQSSNEYQKAMEYTNSLLKQISSGRTSYTDQIKDLMDQIQNRDPFKYDVDQDALFQQYLSSSMASGKTAMQDTIGQASALTGGYGSTYATAVGNQQYNAYIQDAYNNLPEYYNLALEAYQMEGEEMYNQLGMLNQADATEYERKYNSWQANFTNAQQMYQNEYSAWQDTINNAFNVANMQNSDYWDNKDLGYKYASLKQDQEQFEKNYELNQPEMKLKKESSETVEYKEPSPSQYSEILRILNEEGEEAMYKYVDSLGSDVDVEAINNHINLYGRGNVKGRTFTIISPGASKRYAGKINHGVFRDQYGNDYTLEEIEAIDKSAADKLRGLKKGQKVTID